MILLILSVIVLLFIATKLTFSASFYFLSKVSVNFDSRGIDWILYIEINSFAMKLWY